MKRRVDDSDLLYAMVVLTTMAYGGLNVSAGLALTVLTVAAWVFGRPEEKP